MTNHWILVYSCVLFFFWQSSMGMDQWYTWVAIINHPQNWQLWRYQNRAFCSFPLLASKHVSTQIQIMGTCRDRDSSQISCFGHLLNRLDEHLPLTDVAPLFWTNSMHERTRSPNSRAAGCHLGTVEIWTWSCLLEIRWSFPKMDGICRNYGVQY